MEFIQTTYLSPLFDQLSISGVAVDHYVRRAGLGQFRISDPNVYLPAPLVYKMLKDIDRRELSSSPVDDLAMGYRLEHIGSFGKTILTAPSMLAAAARVADPRAAAITYNTTELDICGPTSFLYDRFDHDHSRSARLIEDLSLVLLLDTMVKFGGHGCKPVSLEITRANLPEHGVPIDLSNTRILLGRSVNKIEFPSSWLGNRYDELPESKAPRGHAPTGCLSDRMFTFLNSMEFGSRPSIDLVATSADCSRRTLQRRLAAEGTNFQEIHEIWSMTTALRFIEDPAMSITEISERLGYSDPSHFTRAFREWTGQSPSEYRGNLT